MIERELWSISTRPEHGVLRHQWTLSWIDRDSSIISGGGYLVSRARKAEEINNNPRPDFKSKHGLTKALNPHFHGRCVRITWGCKNPALGSNIKYRSD